MVREVDGLLAYLNAAVAENHAREARLNKRLGEMIQQARRILNVN